MSDIQNPLDGGVSDGGVTPVPETERVVKAYAKVLEEKPEPLVSEATLPFPKQAIKEALKAEVLKARNPRFSLVAGTCYRQLAGFRSAAEIAAWKNATTPASGTDEAVMSEGKRAIEKVWKEDLDALILDWQSYLSGHGLA